MKAPVNPAIALPVMEHFYTIQGEGFYQGSAAYFVRLGGCDVGCPWCDVKESWDAGKHPLISVDDIVAMVVASGAKICVITGGEPLMHNLDELTRVLHSKNVRTNIETSGAYPLSGEWDWICVSPKRFKLPLKECLAAANELKVVIAHRNDLRWAEQNAAGVNAECRLFLQPEWDDAEEILPLMIDYVKNNQQWELSLQIHKYLNVP
ncbi:MAG TPA: 7-carboxy-7-deazaguanine synthase QueE [Chitinophagales bacterium]|nr:7-carboxy-7-deazaguanine synthase QueE [Chitinophagales bacterium]